MAKREVRCRRCILKAKSGSEYPCNECTEIVMFVNKFTNHFIDENEASAHTDTEIRDSSIIDE